MAGQIKPPFAYYGGKMILGPKIAEILPPHKHYVEPFAGSLAVLLAKKPSEAETVNDLDGDLVNFWRVLRDQPEELERQALLTPYSREEYRASSCLEGVSDMERARRIMVRLNQGRSNSMEPQGWRNGRKARPSMGLQFKNRAQRITPAAERMATVVLENRDAVEMIRDYGQEPTVCIYADPPYLGSTRATNYKHEMLTDDLHEQLAAALNNCKASVVLSGYASPLYEELFTDWHRTELKAPNVMSGRAAENEILWSNVLLGAQESFNLGALA